jgi:replicative DNA helicase
MAVSAIGRASYAEAGLSAYKESGGIEYGADLAAILTPSKDKFKGEDPVEGVARRWDLVHCDIVKNRNGERARVDFRFFKAISRFVETDKSTLSDEAA